MSPKRFFQRILFHGFKIPIRLFCLLDIRKGMILYILFLKKFGMRISGKPRYIAPNVIFDDFDKIYLSDRVVISGDCHFLTHDYSYTTALIAVNGKEPVGDIAIISTIKVGKNVFVGKRSLILPGADIGDNCIIGAGSVVRGHIPPNSVYLGNPGLVVGSIETLYSKWNKKDNIDFRSDV